MLARREACLFTPPAVNKVAPLFASVLASGEFRGAFAQAVHTSRGCCLLELALETIFALM